jgi:hypothetical protein
MTSEGAKGSSLSAPFEKELTDEEIRQLEHERDERLDPKNRPRNCEVDNTRRGWDNERGDFRDNLEGHPPEWDCSDGAGKERDPKIWQRVAKQMGAA